MKQTKKQKEWKQNHYLNNKDLYREKQNSKRKEIKKFIDERKEKCIVCNESDKCCLDFHHRDGNIKVDEITNAIKNKWSKEKILLEIDKCDVVCSNCHRKLHNYNLTSEELKLTINLKTIN